MPGILGGRETIVVNHKEYHSRDVVVGRHYQEDSLSAVDARFHQVYIVDATLEDPHLLVVHNFGEEPVQFGLIPTIRVNLVGGRLKEVLDQSCTAVSSAAENGVDRTVSPLIGTHG